MSSPNDNSRINVHIFKTFNDFIDKRRRQKWRPARTPTTRKLGKII